MIPPRAKGASGRTPEPPAATSKADAAAAKNAGAYSLFTDGGSRGNPGPAAAGIVLSDPAGRIIHSSGHFLGRATNNIAEYRAMIFGLQEALRREITHLRVCSDSELMVHQLNGVYRVKNEHLRPLYEQALGLLQRFKQISIEHIRREGNTLADDMVNRALNAKADVRGPAFGGATAATAAGGAAATSSVPQFTARCTAEADEECPGVVSAEGEWPFKGTVPPGLCIYAAAGILQAVLSAAAGAETIAAACARPGCPARFQIRLRRP